MLLSVDREQALSYCLEEQTEYRVQSYDQVESLQEEFSKLTKLRTLEM